MLKANCSDCISSLTTCSMSKTLFECSLVYYEHAFIYDFAITISFWISLLSILNRFLSVFSFVLSPEEAARCAL